MRFEQLMAYFEAAKEDFPKAAPHRAMDQDESLHFHA
jgi:hypothetical protein